MNEPKTQQFYTFDCMNAFLADKLFPVATFEGGDAEAIKTAANYEATLYKHTFQDGERVECVKLYDPWACFDEEATV